MSADFEARGARRTRSSQPSYFEPTRTSNAPDFDAPDFEATDFEATDFEAGCDGLRLAPMARTAGAFALLSAWLVLLLLGWSAGGAVYLLLVAALVVFPWRELRRRV
jgi:hypothetical protein